MAERFGEVFRIGYHNPVLVGIYLLPVGGFIYGVLRPRSSAEWRSLGVAQAFVVALYAEMYGLPLTMFGLAWLTGRSDYANDHFHGHAWAYLLGWDETGAIVLTLLGNLLLAAGGLLALNGWRQIHRGGGELVRTGLYRRIRHPQYTGFFLFLTGSILNWPTLPTLLMFPVLIWLYARLAHEEEVAAEQRFGTEYVQYRVETGRFWPTWPGSWRPACAARDGRPEPPRGGR